MRVGRPRSRPWGALISTLLCLAGAGLLGASDPAAARPAESSSAAPTADPGAPTPTAPDPAGPPLGTGPHGEIVGGPTLGSRDVVTAPGVPALPGGIDAHGWLVTDLGSGEVLAGRDPHGRYYPASTLKTLTLISLHPHLDPATVLTATYEDASVEGSRVGIVEKGQYTVAQLWTALMLQSGNDAASMLMTAVGGRDTAVDLMRQKAESIQAYDTVPGGVSGLDVAGQTSSPYDLCLIIRDLIENPATRAIAGQTLGELPPVPPKYPQPLVYGTDIQVMLAYPGAIAAKSGFTDAARHTYVAAAQRGDRVLAVSVMQAENKPVPTWQQVTTLLDWGFSTAPQTAGLGRLVRPGEASPGPSPASAGPDPESSAAPSSSERARPAAEAAGETERGRVLWPLIPIGVLLTAGAVWIAGPRRRGG